MKELTQLQISKFQNLTKSQLKLHLSIILKY
jgi:hypothetical protein